MTGSLTTDPAALAKEAANFERISDELKAVVARVESTAGQLKADCQGRAGDAIQSAFERYRQAAMAQAQQLNDISTNIQTAGVHYSAADEEAARRLAGKMHINGDKDDGQAQLVGSWKQGPDQPHAGITLDELQQIMPDLSRADAERYLPFLNQAMIQGGINTPRRQAAFLAQVAVESGELKYWEEIGDEAYFRSFLGDDWYYHGRGPLQLTHSSTYLRASQDLGLGDTLLKHPELVAQPEMGFRTSVWFWDGGNPAGVNLNELADKASPTNLDAFRQITIYVRGDAAEGSHYAERVQFYQRACQVLGPQ